MEDKRIEEIIEVAIDRMMQKLKDEKIVNEPEWSRSYAQEYLSVSPATMTSYVQKGLLTNIGTVGKMIFRASEVKRLKRRNNLAA